MYLRKTIIASAVALVLASTSLVVAEKAPFNDQLPVENLPMIEKAPGGFFVGAPIINNMTVMIVRVFNSQGEQVLNVRSNGEPVELLAANMPDGEYHYQVKTIYQLAIPTGSGPEFTNEGMSSDSGSFYIHDNEVIHTDLNQKNQISEELGFIDAVRNSALTSIGRALHSLIPAAVAANVSTEPDGDYILEDDSPAMFIYHNNNTTSTSGRVEWWRWNYFDTDGVGSDTQGIELRDKVSGTVVIDIQGGTGTDDSIQIYANGDINWAGQSMFLDKSTDELALGSNSTPAQLSLFDISPDIRFHDESDTSEAELRLNGGQFTLATRPTSAAFFTTPISIDVNAPTNSLVIAANGSVTVAGGITSSNTIFTVGNASTSRAEMSFVDSAGSMEIEYGGLGSGLEFEKGGIAIVRFDMDAPGNSLMLDGSGNISMGSLSPTASLHVSRSDGTASVLVEETNGTAAPRTLFKIANNGNTKFSVKNTQANVEWAFANPGTGFRLSRQGSGVVEMEILNNGNMVIAGALTQNSDINAKTAITAIDPDKILAQVASLDIQKWEYKDARGEAHIGPMAQDFYATFNLGGTETGISTIDTAGVALVAIQQLNRLNADQAKTITGQAKVNVSQTKINNQQAKTINQLKLAHQQLLAAHHAQEEKLQRMDAMEQKLERMDELEQTVSRLVQSLEGKSIYTSLK